jgi:hypothetical protein
VLREKKAEMDVTTMGTLMETEAGRDKIAAYCVQDTRLTWALWRKFNGFLFA